MKSFNCFLAALLLCLTLCGCQTERRELPPEITTVPEMKTAGGFSAVTNYVRSARDQSFAYTDKNENTIVCDYSIPALVPDSDDAKAINEEILAAYGEYFSAAQIAVNNNRDPEPDGIRYNAYLNDDIVTIVIVTEAQGHNLSYRVYNYNKATDKRLDNDGLLHYLQRDAESTYEELKNALTEDYTAKYSADNYPDDYYYQLDLTTNDEALRQSQFYLNADAELYAVCTEYISMGNGSYQVLIAA